MLSKSTRYPKEVKDEAMKLLKEGRERKHITEILNLGPNTLVGWIANEKKRLGIPTTSRTGVSTVEKKTEILTYYDEGHSSKETTDKYKLGKYTLKNWLYGRPKNRKDKIKSKNKPKIEDRRGVFERVKEEYIKTEKRLQDLHTTMTILSTEFN